MRWICIPLVWAALGCGGPPKQPAATEPTAPEPSGKAADPELNSPDAGGSVDDSDASAPEAAAAYTEPPPQVVRRHHVFATMYARAAKKVIITSVLTTAADEAESLAVGTEALLEFKAKGTKEWVPVADVTVQKVSLKGSRVAGNERQQIELEISQTHDAAKGKGKHNPFARNGRVRLQVDRPDRKD
jgi:hypothetical protein